MSTISEAYKEVREAQGYSLMAYAKLIEGLSDLLEQQRKLLEQQRKLIRELQEEIKGLKGQTNDEIPF